MADGMGILSGATSGAATGSAGGPAGMAIGAGLGAISAAKSNDMTSGEYNDLNKQMGLQSMWNNTQAEKSYELQQRMFDYTADYNSAANQVKRLKEAGLNPALMYGMQGAAGGTGQTGSASASGVGANASDTAERRQASAIERGMALQEAKLAADIRLTNSQADNLDVDAKKKSGVDTELAETQIGKLAQETKNERVRESLLLIERDIQSFSAQDQIETIRQKAIEAQEEVRSLQRHNKIGDETANNMIDEIKYRAIGAGLQNEMTKQGIQLTKDQSTKLLADIAIAWENVDINDKNAASAALNAESNKLTAEYTTGKTVNWKNVTELIIDGAAGVGSVGRGAGAFKELMKSGPKAIKGFGR